MLIPQIKIEFSLRNLINIINILLTFEISSQRNFQSTTATPTAAEKNTRRNILIN